MKITSDTVVNITLSCACVVMATVGVIDISQRVVRHTVPQASPQGVTAVTDVKDITIAINKGTSHLSHKSQIALIEFSDFQCPYCGNYARETYARIESDYVRTGKLNYVFFNLPIESAHPLAMHASEALECSGVQGKAWEMHDALFGNQTALTHPDLIRYAKSIGLDLPVFETCIGGLMLPRIRNQLEEARRYGISSTPTFLIASIQPDGAARAIQRIVGAVPYETLKTAIESAFALKAQSVGGH
jgi:protein-disulfide isomerase